MAYKLALPEGSSVYPVFHVSLLRQALPDKIDALVVPFKILAQRWRKIAKKKFVEQVLTHWSTGTDASVIWENCQELYSHFPSA